jgi:protein gp37
MSATSIEWTDHSINPLRARLGGRVGHYCQKVSPGCKNCYSSRTQPRFGMPTFSDARSEAIEHLLDPRKLEEVLHRKKPTKWFWCDMTDMFGDWVPFEWIAACFGVMAATPHHTHQVLTKRPQRALEWFKWIAGLPVSLGGPSVNAGRGVRWFAWNHCDEQMAHLRVHDPAQPWIWPLPNVWLGTSAENQATADERIPMLLDCPAAVRFISAEPLLGPLELSPWLRGSQTRHLCVSVSGSLKNGSYKGGMLSDASGRTLSDAEAKRELEQLSFAGVKVLRGDQSCDNFSDQTGCLGHRNPRLDWVIVGGESGPGARPFDLKWADDLRKQCAHAQVPYFFKQAGAAPQWSGTRIPLELKHRKGADLSELPEGLRVRQFPVAP